MNDARQALIAAVGQAAQASQRSTDALDDAVAVRLGVNRTDLRCLDWLFSGPMSVGQLTQATGLSSAATTTLLDRLEAKGLVQRRRDTTDRRKVLVEMTDFGRRLSGEVYLPIVGEGASLLERFSDEQLTAIREYLDASRDLIDDHRARLHEGR